MDVIQGEKFIKLADNKKIYYCHTHEVNNFFLNSVPTHPFILISHNSDGRIRLNQERFDDAAVKYMPQNLYHWFGQNVCVKHEKITSLPIGLENSQWFVDLRKKEKIINARNAPKQYVNTVYLNLNINNNPPERSYIYDIAKNKSHITVHYGKNGVNFDTYLHNLHNHKFMICPPGNGEDVHQPWESMYINTIPLMKKSINNLFYEDLPICFLDDWNQINDVNFLNDQFTKINSSCWNTSKLFFNYWKTLILNKANEI
jgi:hypothetical protein